jgi:hypothetical protein
VSPGSTETPYFNMPARFGLASVTGAVPATVSRAAARERLHDGAELPSAPSGRLGEQST